MHKIVKRRRTAHACESCRYRKSRCDGKRPICGVCRRTGNDCNYLVPAKSTQQSLPEETSHAVETRLQALEHTLHDFIAQQASFTKLDEVSPQVSPSKPAHVSKLNTSQHATDPSAVNWDVVGGVGSIAPKEELGKTYFGPTSTSAFLAQINRFLAQRAPIPLDSISGTLNTTATNYSTTYMSRPNTPTPSKSTVAGSLQANSSHILDDSSFPPRTELLRLVDVFFSNSGTLFPFLRKSRIFQMCLKIDTVSHRSNNSSEMCIVYMVLALASIFNTFDTDAEQKLREGEVFLQRALAYLSEIMRQTLTLESVQALVLVTKYFQGTRRAGQMWSMHSTTVQAAIQIGMCSTLAASNVTAAEAESWKRTWWMCFQMDRMCSMTFGRPPLIPNSFMRHSLPSNHSYESLEEENIRITTDASSEGPSESSLIIHTSKLNFILGDVVEHIYQQNIELTPKVTLADILIEITKTDKQLDQWENELPEFLGLIDTEEAGRLSEIDRTRRFRIILTLRYHSVRALAHRAILNQVMENNNDFQFAAIGRSSQRNFPVASLESCLESSSASIEIISSTVLQEGSLPVWWFSIYYIFNSALNIFALLLISIKHDLAFRSLSSEQLLELLKQADTTLNNIKGSIELRERCCKVLRRLIQIASISLQGKAAMPTSMNISAGCQNDSFNFTSSAHPRFSFPDPSTSAWDESMLVSDLDPFLLDPLDEDELSWFL